MAAYAFSAPRLFVEDDLVENRPVGLDRARSNYLLHVLRLQAGSSVLVFNGRDGEWRAVLSGARRDAALTPTELTRPQPARSDLLYLFAPLKHARTDYMVQKAVEMGVGTLRPVFTRRTVASRVNLERMRANAVEASEQCGILCVPDVLPALGLDMALSGLGSGSLLVFADEDAPVADPLAALGGASGCGIALIVGPEGGFAPEERELLLRQPNVRRISLGPRILRADTAAVAALAVLQATIGDWRREGVVAAAAA